MYLHTQDGSSGDKLDRLPPWGTRVRAPRQAYACDSMSYRSQYAQERVCDRPLEGWGMSAESEQLAYTPHTIEPGYYDTDWTTHWVATDDLRMTRALQARVKPGPPVGGD